MKRFASGSKANLTSSTSATSSSNAASCQPDAAMNTMTFRTHHWLSLQSMQLSGKIPRSPHIMPDEVYVSFTVKNLCRGPLALVYCDVLLCKSSGMHPHHLMMNACLLAMAKVFYGFQNRETKVMQDGLRLYGRGLSMLGDFLSKADCSVTTEMIISVFSLCVGEVCTLTSHTAFRLWFANLKSRRASYPLASLHGWFIFSASSGSLL